MVLAGAVTKALGDVVFVTKPRWRAVAAALHGVVSTVGLGEDALPAAAARVVDLQGNQRSARARRAIQGPTRAVQHHRLRRHLRVWAKLATPPPTVVARYAAAAGVAPAAPPWVTVDGPADALLLVVGAAWATKRWPVARWVAVGRGWPGPVVVLGGPGDRARVQAVVGGIGPRAEACAEDGFDATFRALGRGARAVGGDSGLTHLCAAAGIPTVGVFGPTTSADGFWSWPGPVVERADLPCRPCSRFGSASCPVGDHACLADLPAGAALDALRSLG